jgi:hypothetical protein
MNANAQQPAADECWSIDQERYEAGSLSDFISSHEDLEPGRVIWRGTTERPNNTHLCDANDVIDTLADRAGDFAGEYAEDYPHVSAEARAELDQLLSDWIDKHAEPHFFIVNDTQPYTLTEADFITREHKQ